MPLPMHNLELYMKSSIPTNPSKYFDIKACANCKHRACSSLPTEKMTSIGIYRFEVFDSTDKDGCPFHSNEIDKAIEYLSKQSVEKINQTYRYIMIQFKQLGIEPNLSFTYKNLEDRATFIVAFVKELLISKQLSVFAVDPNYNNEPKIKWWMRAHIDLINPGVVAN